MDSPFQLSGFSSQLTHILDALGEGFGIIDEQENFLFVNQTAAAIFGYTKDELVGTNLSEYMSEEEFKKILQQTVDRREGKISTYFHTIISKDGTPRELQSTVSPHIENGRFTGSYGIIRDITESIRDKERLEESEKRFRTVSDVISDFAISFTVTEDHLFIPEWHSGIRPLERSHAADAILEFKDWINTCHPDDLPVLQGAMERIMKEREPITFEYRIRTNEQGYEWFEIIANPELQANTNRIGRIIVAGRNITEKKNAELIHQITYSIVNAINDASTISDIFGGVRNELEKYLDCRNLYMGLVTSEEGLMETYFQKGNQVVREISSYIRTLNNLVIETQKQCLLTRSDILKLESQGSINPYASPAHGWVGIPLLIGDEAIGILSVSSFEKEVFLNSVQLGFLNYIAPHLSMTIRRKQDEEALKASEASLRESNMSKDKFFSIIAHDLRGPFNAIIGFSDLLHNDFETLEVTEQRSMIKNIYDASVGTFKLLENLLEWSRIQTGRTKPNPENVDLSTIANTSLSFLKHQAEKKNIKLFSGIHFGTIAYCDENMITTVIRNLISNAIKFTQPGGNVRIWSGISENVIEVTVSDNGIGIPRANIEKLFRLDESVKTRGTAGEQGTGLGLLLCREFIELNKGTIQAESEPGKGSKFKFTLPKQVL